MQTSQWVFMCSGQGSQKSGMGASLVSNTRVSQAFECASDVFGIDVGEIASQAPAETLNATTNAQAIICSMSIGIAFDLMDMGINPAAVLGLSLGQISALAIARVLSIEETFKLLHARAAAMDRTVEENPGIMSAFMKGTAEEVEEICLQCSEDEVLVPANYNAPGQIVVSGNIMAVERAETAWEKRGYRTRRLATAGAFHSPLMQTAADEFSAYLSSVDFKEPRIPLICNTDASPLRADEARKRLADHLTHPVRFEQSMRYLSESGYGKFAEVGFGGTLANLARRILPDSERFCIQDDASIRAFVKRCSASENLD